MELEFLGTSSAVPSKQRNHTSISLKAFGEVMLFDCGEGTQRQLTNAHISPMKINKIFITHFHGDHILGLPGLIQSMGFRGRENRAGRQSEWQKDFRNLPAQTVHDCGGIASWRANHPAW